MGSEMCIRDSDIAAPSRLGLLTLPFSPQMTLVGVGVKRGPGEPPLHREGVAASACTDRMARTVLVIETCIVGFVLDGCPSW